MLTVSGGSGRRPPGDREAAGQEATGREAAGQRMTGAGRAWRRLYLPTFAFAVAAAWLAWTGWAELSEDSPVAVIHSAQLELAGPAVVGFVLVVFIIEQIRPAERHPLLARGHVLDMTYLLAYALLVVPLIALIGTGFSAELARAAPWLVLPHVTAVPHWLFIAVAVVAIDAVDWVAHLGNHRVNPLWRLHAVHHSQEELSILTTFRAHPLVHISFLLSALPVLALAANDATPSAVLTVYACLGALPHANVRWTYGKAGAVFISPAYHRIHHSATGRLDINLGTVLTIWDRMSGRAVFPARGARPGKTGLAGRPVPVEQPAGWPRLARIFLIQWAEPFTTSEVSDQ
jgi:sterol desaturase/sphingolipid hydroxylase (fatty acid hydroxylase superfamily)